jgi:hypothetical protein
MPYVVGTDPCSYLLSDDGICVRVQASGHTQVSPSAGSPHTPQAALVGAQFVAGLDVTAPGGLVGGLEVGSAALFVKQDENGRFVLLRTAPIRSVQERGLKKKPALPKSSIEGDETTLTLVKTAIPAPPPVPRLPLPTPPALPSPRAPQPTPARVAPPRLPERVATRPDLPAPPIFQIPAVAQPTSPSVYPSPWDEPPTHRMMRDDMRKPVKKKKK